MAKFYFYPPKSAGAAQYYKDGSLTSVGIDTVTPANSNPMPVLVLDSAGIPFDWTDLAQEATLQTRASEATLAAAAADIALLEAKDFATETTLSALNAKLQSKLLSAGLAGTDLGIISQSVIHGLNSGGGGSYVDVKVTPSGALVTDATISGTVAVTQSGTWSVRTQDGSGNAITSTANALDVNVKNASIAVTGTFWQATQPISAVALPLPTGAATETTLSAISAQLPATLGQKTMANSMAVVLSSDQSSIPVTGTFWQATQPVSIAATVSTNVAQIAGTTTSVNSGNIDNGTQRVVIATDQPAVPVSGSFTVSAAGWKEKYRHVFSTTTVTTAAYTQLVASTANNVTEFEIYSTSNETLVLATGAAAAEVDKFYINPGGNDGRVVLSVASGTRISLKAVTANASSGYININMYG